MDGPEWLKRYLEWRTDYQRAAAQIAFLQAIEGQVIENSEPDNKNLVPITDAEAYRMQDALERANNLRDMGIHPESKWRLVGRCSRHGLQVHIIDSVEDEPTDIFIGCWDCGAINIHRLLPVIERAREP